MSDHEPYQEENNATSAKRGLVIGLIAALTIINGIFLYNWIQQKNINKSLEKELTLTDSLKRNLEGLNETNISKINEQEIQISKKDSFITLKENEIETAKARLAELNQKQKITASELSEAKSLIKSLRAAESLYKIKIDSFLIVQESLVEEKEKLMAENVGLKTDLSKEKENVANLQSDKSTLENEKFDLIKKGEVLKVSNISFIGIQQKGSKTEETDKVNKLDRIDISFDVLANPIAKSDTRKACVVIKDPNGLMLSSNESSANCTKTVTFDYENGGKTVKASFVPKGKMKEGRYIVEVYIDGQLAGKGSDKLRKTIL